MAGETVTWIPEGAPILFFPLESQAGPIGLGQGKSGPTFEFSMSVKECSTLGAHQVRGRHVLDGASHSLQPLSRKQGLWDGL